MTSQNNAAQAADKELREAFELIYAADADDPACAADLFHFTNGWRACIMSKLRAPVADERALIAEATGHVTEALVYVDRVAQRKAIGYSDFGVNPRRHHNDTRPYNLKDARQDAYTAAILLRKAWDVLDPSTTPRDAAQASAPVAGEAPTDDEIIDMAVEPLGIDCDRMPYGVVLFARALLSRYAAPQASAEDVRNSALILQRQEWANRGDGYGHWVDVDEARFAILAPECRRTLYLPQADKDGGQQRAGDDKEP